jgi:hypothetical protein
MPEPTVPKVREASLVHRLFGITPGYAPERAYRACRGSCEPRWREFVLVWAVIGFALLAWWVASWAGVGAVTAVVLVGAVLVARFASRERFGRARLHRGECVWCGHAPATPGRDCLACGRIT